MKGNTLELRRQDKAARVPKDPSDFTGKLRSTDPVGGLGLVYLFNLPGILRITVVFLHLRACVSSFLHPRGNSRWVLSTNIAGK